MKKFVWLGWIGALLGAGAACADSSPEPIPFSLVARFGVARFVTNPLPLVAAELAYTLTPRTAALLEVGSPLAYVFPLFPYVMAGGRVHVLAPTRGSWAPFLNLKAGLGYPFLCIGSCDSSASLAIAGTGVDFVWRDGLLLRLEVGRWFSTGFGDPGWFAALAIGKR